MKLKVGVFFGSRSVEHEVSIVSAMQVINALDKDLYDVVPIYISKQGSWYTGKKLLNIENYKDFSTLFKQSDLVVPSLNTDDFSIFHYPKFLGRSCISQIDVAFPVLHGTYGEDGTLQGVFEMMGIPYVGCNVEASANTMNKITSKMILSANNLPVLDYIAFTSQEWFRDSEILIQRTEHKFSYPLIVKPYNLGSSIGVKRCENRQDLIKAVELIRSLSARIMVEPFVLNLKEINCSALGDSDAVEVSLCEEPLFNCDIQSFEDKYLSNAPAKGMSGLSRKLPADISDELKSTIQDMSRRVFQSFGCSGVVRVDYLLDQSMDKVYVNEVNPLPGSFSFYLWEPTGKTFTQLTSQLIELALKRKRLSDQLVVSYDSNILASQRNGSKGIKSASVKEYAY